MSNTSSLLSISSNPDLPRCSQYLEDLLCEQKQATTAVTVKTPCDLCNHAIGFHTRKPSESVNSSTLSLPVSYSRSASSSSAVKNLPKWKIDYKHVKPFLQRFEQILTAENVDESQWSRYLLYSVENVSEAEWVKSNLIGVKDWEKVKKEFTKHFGYHSHELKLQQDYESCKQQKHETVQKYADRFNALKDDLQYEDTNKMVSELALKMRTTNEGAVLGMADKMKDVQSATGASMEAMTDIASELARSGESAENIEKGFAGANVQAAKFGVSSAVVIGNIAKYIKEWRK